jgi:hypothetical protein
MDNLLGKQLASQVKLRFGTIRHSLWGIEGKERPTYEAFLYLASEEKVFCWEPTLDDMSGEPRGGPVKLHNLTKDAGPTAIERWAFFKVVELLDLDCDSSEPNRLLASFNEFDVSDF